MQAAKPLAHSANDPEILELINSIHIPPRPSLLSDLQLEMQREDPDFQAVTKLIGQDVALSGALLKAANSVIFHLQRKADSVGGALASLGLRQVSMLVGGFLVRRSFATGNCELVNFWDLSAKRALAMTYLARELRAVAPELAHTFGLFADLGVPLLLERFSEYADTLQLANATIDKSFTAIEDERHHTNHAVIGALLARNWTLPHDVVMAIRLHHDYAVFSLSQASLDVRRLIALGVVSDIIIHKYLGHSQSNEQRHALPMALCELGIANDELEDISYQVSEVLGSEG